VADSDFRAPPVVLQAIAERLEHGVLGYTAPPDELREAIVARLTRLYRWRVDPASIVFLPGVIAGLHHAARVLVGAGEKILVPRPVYHHLKRAPELAPRPFAEAALVLHAGRWVFDEDAVKKHSDARAFYLCNPQNPGGTIFRRDELQRLAELTGDMLIVSDEIHCDLLLDRDKPHTPIASLSPDISRRTVTLMSPNKAFNVPSAGCAFAVIEDPTLRRRFAQDVDLHVMPSAGVFGYITALAAYRHGEPWLQAQLEYLRGNRELVEKFFGATLAHVEATYLAWIDCSTQPDALERCLKSGVALSPGAQFGDARFVRLNFGTQRAVLKEALERMRKPLAAVRA
jgi:bifunctional pyridoxal-dependent enzyme with beta-cystathionase and maltose regulon repressor activities